jgi:aconitate hydratase
MRSHGGHVVVAGENYAQGSSREHAALAPRYLGQVAVLAKSYARLGWQNLINFGILPLEFSDKADYGKVQAGDVLAVSGLRDFLSAWADGTGSRETVVKNGTRGEEYAVTHGLSPRQAKVMLAGGVIGYYRLAMLSPPGDRAPNGEYHGLDGEHVQALGQPGGLETVNRADDQL